MIFIPENHVKITSLAIFLFLLSLTTTCHIQFAQKVLDYLKTTSQTLPYLHFCLLLSLIQLRALTKGINTSEIDRSYSYPTSRRAFWIKHAIRIWKHFHPKPCPQGETIYLRLLRVRTQDMVQPLAGGKIRKMHRDVEREGPEHPCPSCAQHSSSSSLCLLAPLMSFPEVRSQP